MHKPIKTYKAMKKYVIMLAKSFPRWHERKGQKTMFTKILSFGTSCYECCTGGYAHCHLSCEHPALRKIHTIRENYELWAKRFEEIEAGNACISIREWEGTPYRSRQKEIIRLTKNDGIGLQRLTFAMNSLAHPFVDGISSTKADKIAHNDGLTYHDWKKWFCKCDLSKYYAIIHFTKFRY